MHHGEPIPSDEQEERFRSHRLATELANRGHHVTYWCSTFEHHKKKLFCRHTTALKVGKYKLIMLHAGEYKTNHSPSRLMHHRRMAKQFAIQAELQPLPDLILCSLPIHYCAFEATKFAKKKSIPIVIDIRDYWPDNLLLALPQSLRWLGKMMLFYDRMITRYALGNATAIVSMMRHLLEWGLREYGHRLVGLDDKVFYIGGDEPGITKDRDFFNCFPSFPEEIIQDRLVVNYIGSFTALTHPMEIVSAAKKIASDGLSEKIVFVLAGKGDMLKKCVKEAQGLQNIFFPGWLNSMQVRTLNAISSVGVLPSYEKYSFPNKTFAYLSSGLPILSSEQGDLKQLLEKYNAGFYFDINKKDDLYEKLKMLLGFEKDGLAQLRANAKKLFWQELRASKIYSDFADYLERIAIRGKISG